MCSWYFVLVTKNTSTFCMNLYFFEADCFMLRDTVLLQSGELMKVFVFETKLVTERCYEVI